MRSQKSRHDLQRLLCCQLFLQPQNFQLARNVQPVPAFRFNRCCPVRSELFQRGKRALFQSLARRRPQPFHRIENPSTLPRNLFVTRPGYLQFILFCPARRMNQVRV